MQKILLMIAVVAMVCERPRFMTTFTFEVFASVGSTNPPAFSVRGFISQVGPRHAGLSPDSGNDGLVGGSFAYATVADVGST